MTSTSSLALIIALAATTACAPNSRPLPEAPQPAPTQAPTPPDVPVEPTPPLRGDAPDDGPKKGPKLVLKIANTNAQAGDVIAVQLMNDGDADFVYHFPGASNGCGRFRWEATLVHEDGTALSARPWRRDELCTMAIIPPYDIVIKPGEAHELSVDTGATWWGSGALTAIEQQPQVPKPGAYTLRVRGASQLLGAALHLNG